MARIARRLFVLVAAALALAGCLSPTLPLPPPSKPTVEGPDQNGEVTLSGHVQAGANVFAANYRTGDIRGQIDLDGDGNYAFKIPAEVGDELELWYTMGTDTSPSVSFKVPPPQ